MGRALLASVVVLLVASAPAAGAARAATVTLSLEVTGVGGAVATSPPGVGKGCSGRVCSIEFEIGTMVTLTATTSGRARFHGWFGNACSGPYASCTVMLSGGRSVVAAFSPVRLYVEPTPGQGSVSVSPPGVPCGPGCGEYDYGSVVVLRAAECCGYSFRGWSGTCSSVASPGCRTTLTRLAQAVPIFRRCSGGECLGTTQQPLSRDVPAKVLVYGGGRIAVNGKECRGSCTFTFTRGQSLRARAYDEARFVAWGGSNCNHPGPTCQFEAYRDAYGKPPTITATFR